MPEKVLSWTTEVKNKNLSRNMRKKGDIMKKNVRFSAIALAVISLVMSSLFSFSVSANATDSQAAVYIPLWMQPNTVIVFDSNLDYVIVQGGELSASDIIGREDIKAVGLTTTDPGMLAQPNTKVEYEQHGFFQNIYFLGTDGEYHLSPPEARIKLNTGILDPGETTGNYGRYYNYDTQAYQYNQLTRSSGSGSTISGTGRITYYTDTTGDHSNTLVKYDCAAKMYECDVASDKAITAKNTYTTPVKSRVFYKEDCGALPSAILDIWVNTSDSTKQAIRDITTSGGLDNVYSASIQLTV
jgi:hypothetical protein